MLRTTRIFGIASLGVLAFGIAAAQELHKLSSPWVTTAMTLFVVSLVLLVLIMRDQRRAVVALETASETEALATANNAPAGDGQNGRRRRPRRSGPPGRADGPRAARGVGGTRPHRLPGRHRHPALAGNPGPHGLELLARPAAPPGPRPRPAAINQPGRTQVLEQVVAGLDADRQADEVAGHLQRGPGRRGVRHPARMLDQRLDPAKRLARG